MNRCLCCLLLIVMFGVPTFAICDYPQPRLVRQEYFDEQVVVIAKLASVQHIKPEDEMDYFLYRLEVSRTIKGRIDRSFTIWEENSSARASFEWRKGHEYLLFVSYEPHLKKWTLDGCGNSAEVKNATKTLAVIANIQAGKTGSCIQGTLTEEAQGFRVRLSSPTKTYIVLTNKQGEFNVALMPGIYRATVLSDESRFEPYEFNYGNPNRLVVPKGGCAQVAFQRSSNKN